MAGRLVSAWLTVSVGKKEVERWLSPPPPTWPSKAGEGRSPEGNFLKNKECFLVSGALRVAGRSSINDKGGWEAELLCPGPGGQANGRGSEQRLLFRAHVPWHCCACLLPVAELHPSWAWALQGLPGGRCCTSCSSGVSLAGGLLQGHSLMALPWGRLPKHVALGLPPGYVRGPENLLGSWELLEHGNDRGKRRNISRKLISSKMQNGFKEGRQFSSCCCPG